MNAHLGAQHVDAARLRKHAERIWTLQQRKVQLIDQQLDFLP